LHFATSIPSSILSARLDRRALEIYRPTASLKQRSIAASRGRWDTMLLQM